MIVLQRKSTNRLTLKNKTKYFQNCLGVFQGGGCKGPAYVGAYKVAVERGVSFSELVGTSAGSIIAALIGAGASPEYLEKTISELNFLELLAPPKKIDVDKVGWRVKLYLKGLPQKYKKYTPIIDYLGLYNSERLKSWINDRLAELLPDVKGSIKFKHLNIPTSIVVSDIASKRIEVFSKEKSPEKDICEAIQKSCNIPFFFQPIGMRYVDGGILSNLPTFIFENHPEKLYNKILAFSLESKPEKKELKDLLEYSKALLETTLDGNLDIQLSLQHDLHIVKINTGTIKAIDFEKITSENIQYLINQGQKATESFFDEEKLHIKQKINRSDITHDDFATKNFIVQTLNSKHKEVLISGINSKDWVYELFLSFIKWKENGTNISVLFEKENQESSNQKFRIRFLENLGIEVKIIDSLPFQGIIFDGDNSENCRAIIFNTDKEKAIYDSKLYFGKEDSYVISLLHEKIKHFFTNSQSKLTSITIEAINENELFSHLREVKQYSDATISLEVKEIEIENVRFLTNYVLGYQYRQIGYLFQLYTKFGIEHFMPAKLNLLKGNHTIITPPIVEELNGKFYIIDGNAKLTYAFRNGMKSLTCVIVKGVHDPLPSKGDFTAKQILLSDIKKVGSTRYKDFDYDEFRNIEANIRNPEKCLL